MTPKPDSHTLGQIAHVMLVAGHPPESIEDKARLWLALRPLIDGYKRSPDPDRRTEGQGYKKGWELRFAAASPAGVVRITDMLRQLGIDTGRPYIQRDGNQQDGNQERILVPVFGRNHQWVSGLLALDPPPGFSAHGSPTASPTPSSPERRTQADGPHKPRRRRSRIRARTPIPERDSERVKQIIATDQTFEQSTWRGQPIWAGRCLQCTALLMVGLEGEQVSACQIVWIDGDGESESNGVERLGLVCLRCGVLDQGYEMRADPRLAETLEQLKVRRLERWRGPLPT